MTTRPFSVALRFLGLLALESACGPRNGTPRDAGSEVGAGEAGQRPTTPGRYEQSIMVNGARRWFRLYIPSVYNGTTPLPLVFAFHGGNGFMADMEADRDDLLGLHESRGFILVFPNGQNNDGNRGPAIWSAGYCCGPQPSNPNDVDFVQAMIAQLRATLAVDPNRIHAMGFSNGGILSHRLATEMPGTFASFAAFSCSVGGRFLPETTDTVLAPRTPVPALLIHGTHDDHVRYNGGISGTTPERSDLAYARTIDTWVRANGCASVPTREDTAGRLGPVHIDRYAGCRGGADLHAYHVENGLHRWPSATDAGFDGTLAAVDFLLSHPRR